MRRAPASPLFPYTTLFRSARSLLPRALGRERLPGRPARGGDPPRRPDRLWLRRLQRDDDRSSVPPSTAARGGPRSEEHTSELQSLTNLVCRLLLEKKRRLA